MTRSEAGRRPTTLGACGPAEAEGRERFRFKERPGVLASDQTPSYSENATHWMSRWMSNRGETHCRCRHVRTEHLGDQKPGPLSENVGSPQAAGGSAPTQSPPPPRTWAARAS